MKRAWLALAALLATTGCGGRSKTHAPSTSSEPGVAAGTGGSASFAGAAGQADSGGAVPDGESPSDVCASSEGLVLERAPGSSPPSLMLVLDGSAATTASAPYNGSVWDNTASAVHHALLSVPDGILLGVRVFPDSAPPDQAECTTALRAPLKALDAEARQLVDLALLDGGPAEGVRDVYQGYTLATGDLQSEPQPPHEAILLVTTGLPTRDDACVPLGSSPTRTDLAPLFDSVGRAQKDGIDTFVVGSYGSSDAADVLSELAVAGGTPLEPCRDEGADHDCHLDASGSDDVAGALTASLETAVQMALERAGCKLALPGGPGMLPGLLSLSLEGDQGERPLGADSAGSSCPGGWYYTPLDETDTAASGAITLCAKACFDYLADASARVVIRCPNARRPIPPK